VARNHGATAGGRDDLVAVEGVDADVTKGTQRLIIVPRSQCLRSVFNDRNLIAGGDLHDAIYLRRYPVEMNRNNGFDLFAFGKAILDGLFKDIGIHIPGLRLRVDEDRRRTEISHWIARP